MRGQSVCGKQQHEVHARHGHESWPAFSHTQAPVCKQSGAHADGMQPPGRLCGDGRTRTAMYTGTTTLASPMPRPEATRPAMSTGTPRAAAMSAAPSANSASAASSTGLRPTRSLAAPPTAAPTAAPATAELTIASCTAFSLRAASAAARCSPGVLGAAASQAGCWSRARTAAHRPRSWRAACRGGMAARLL